MKNAHELLWRKMRGLINQPLPFKSVKAYLLEFGTEAKHIPLLGGVGLGPDCFTVCHFHLVIVSSFSENLEIREFKSAEKLVQEQSEYFDEIYCPRFSISIT